MLTPAIVRLQPGRGAGYHGRDGEAAQDIVEAAAERACCNRSYMTTWAVTRRRDLGSAWRATGRREAAAFHVALEPRVEQDGAAVRRSRSTVIRSASATRQSGMQFWPQALLAGPAGHAQGSATELPLPIVAGKSSSTLMLPALRPAPDVPSALDFHGADSHRCLGEPVLSTTVTASRHPLALPPTTAARLHRKGRLVYAHLMGLLLSAAERAEYAVLRAWQDGWEADAGRGAEAGAGQPAGKAAVSGGKMVAASTTGERGKEVAGSRKRDHDGRARVELGASAEATARGSEGVSGKWWQVDRGADAVWLLWLH